MNRVPKRALYLIGVVSLAVIAMSTFRLATRAAANSSPFQGISAVENAPVVTPSAQLLAQMKDPNGKGFGGANVGGVRLLPSTIAGHSAYVAPSTYGDFCLFVDQLPDACGGPFTAALPALFVSFDPDGVGGVGTTAFGIAEDGVDSITMTVNGNQITVPVTDNTFEFSGGSSVAPGDVTNVIANFNDGHNVPLG